MSVVSPETPSLPDPAGLPTDLVRCQDDLLRQAARIIPRALQSYLDPADLVQQTLLEAQSRLDRLAGMTEPAVLAYLRVALKNNCCDAIRRAPRGEVSPGVLADSSVRLADRFAADHTSPSERAERIEWLARLEAAVSALPDAQRVAVEMRYLRGLRVAEIARELERTVGAVSLLLHRAMTALRNVLTEPNA